LAERKLIWPARPQTSLCCACELSCPVIGMARQNGDCPVKLLRDQYAHELVGPGHGAEIDDGIRLAAQLGVQPVGAADRHHQVTFSTVAKTADQAGKAFAVQGFSTFVEKEE